MLLRPKMASRIDRYNSRTDTPKNSPFGVEIFMAPTKLELAAVIW